MGSQGWYWPGNTICIFILGSPDLKSLPQASKAPTAPSSVSPAVERVQPVMAPDAPVSPGRMRPGPGLGLWGWREQLADMLLPPPGVPAEPQTVLDALQQRLNKYREASVQARGSGDERKARMHERIAKVGLQPQTCPGSAFRLASCSVHT